MMDMTTEQAKPADPLAAIAPAAAAATSPRTITVLGATGSIGSNTLDLLARDPTAYEVVALTAHRNVDKLAEQARTFRARRAVIADPAGYEPLKQALAGSGIEVAAGADAVVEAAQMPADWTMAAIVGAAGLRPTFAAAQQGGVIALANKECMVSAGAVFNRHIADHGAGLLPVDSEHSAVFQAMQAGPAKKVQKITLTASGGPFRNWSQQRIDKARPEDALKHPNWDMGAKITIDSASLMNKGLELIEAYHLFPVTADQLDVVIHPQSIVHCLVAWSDQSVLAHMSMPDMRTPIAVSLAWPERMSAPTAPLDLASIGRLDFEPPDLDRFPALRLALAVLHSSRPSDATVLNAANEVAVAAFLAGRLSFPGIAALCEACLDKAVSKFPDTPDTLEAVLQIDAGARALATELLG